MFKLMGKKFNILLNWPYDKKIFTILILENGKRIILLTKMEEYILLLECRSRAVVLQFTKKLNEPIQ